MSKDMLELAEDMAQKMQNSKVKKNGTPIVEHSQIIAEMVKHKNEKIVAFLHDACEEGSVCIEELRQKGFSKKIIEAVEAIIPKDDESYNEYVIRVQKNKLARTVKIAELTYGGDLSRIKNPNGMDFRRAKEYATMKRDLNIQRHNRELQSPFDIKSNVPGVKGNKNINKFGNFN